METDVETSFLLAFEVERCVSTFEADVSLFRFTDARALSRRWTNDRRFRRWMNGPRSFSAARGWAKRNGFFPEEAVPFISD
jgi:hypothetical protein